jgi:hypothetical protein
MKKIGYIYILSNEHMPGLVKIGFTDRDPITRSKELSSHTGVPGKFNIEKSWEVLGAAAIEAAVFEELATLRLDGREFFKFSAPAKAINRVTSILLQLGELDANGETVPAKKRLAKQEKEFKKEQDRLAGFKVVEQAWSRQRLRYKQSILSEVESRLQYSMLEVEAEHKKTKSFHERVFRMPAWVYAFCIFIPLGWPILIVCHIIEMAHRRVVDKHRLKIKTLNSEVDKLLGQTKVDFFKDKGYPLKYNRRSARF